MLARRQFSWVLSAALGFGASAPLLACGEKQGPKHAAVQPAPMPEGGDWSGVYYSPLYGNLHLLSSGDAANGAWRTKSGDKWGELHGTIKGNLLRYEWTEHSIGMVGPSATRKGKGYFRYTIPKQGEAHELDGEWGLDADSAGNVWQAVKQMNLVPNLASVKPDEVEGRVGGGGWDDGDSGSSDEGDDSDE